MKQLLLTIIILPIISLSLYAQRFTEVNRSNSNQQVKLGIDQLLEVQLPSMPSTGYAWYVKNVDNTLKQLGDFQFISDNPTQPIGAPGLQFMHFAAVSEGIANLELIYVRPWETGLETRETYKIKVITEGAYSGNYEAAYTTGAKVYTSVNPTTVLPAKFSWLDLYLQT
jgi:predicted secreted protein